MKEPIYLDDHGRWVYLLQDGAGKWGAYYKDGDQVKQVRGTKMVTCRMEAAQRLDASATKKGWPRGRFCLRCEEPWLPAHSYDKVCNLCLAKMGIPTRAQCAL